VEIAIVVVRNAIKIVCACVSACVSVTARAAEIIRKRRSGYHSQQHPHELHQQVFSLTS